MIIAEVQNEIGFSISLLPASKKASFPLSDPHLLCPSHPAESPQIDIFFQLKKEVKEYQYHERQRFRRRLQKWVVREVLNPLGEKFLFLLYRNLLPAPHLPLQTLTKDDDLPVVI